MNEKIKSLYLSYLEKNISKPDEEYLILWLKRNPDYVKEFNEIRRLWSIANTSGKINNILVEKEWNLFSQMVEKEKSAQIRPQNNLMYWLPRMAATFLLGMIISAAIAYAVFNTENSNVVYQEINTPAGAQSKIALPDGSTVWLNAESRLRYSNQFGKKQREIFLTGDRKSVV